ncbi:MAG: DUF885 domain-containing protein [Candidatus Cyclobacteriaceae bacterium M2_1C_046]
MKYIFPLLIILSAFQISVAQDSEKLKSLIGEVKKINESADRNDTLWRGNHPSHIYTTSWDDMLESNKKYQQVYNEIKSLPEDDLSRQDEITRGILLLQVKNNISSIKYKAVLIPFNAEGGFHNAHEYFLHDLPFHNKEDYKAYLSWLPEYANYIRQHQELMERGIKENVMAPKLIVKNMITQLQGLTTTNFLNHPFAFPFQRMTESVNLADSASLVQEARQVLTENIIPAYQGLHEFVTKEYLPAAPEEVGISNIANGREYYEDRIQYYTTLDITPDSVFNLGLHEVERIRREMDKIIRQLNFEGNFQEFIHFLRTDPQFYPKTGQELLNYASWLSKKAEGELPKLFSSLYSIPFTVEPVPAAIAPTYTGGRYVQGSRKQDRAGIYWVNTYNLPSRTLYTIPALTLHEAVPGHHLQIMKAAELEDIPQFRKTYYISAFGEGWGLYAEYLGEEMGMYPTPYDLFGRYTYEMWRACRLVVDVGMHYKGWDREKAFKFMSENTALSIHEVNTEIDRYIGWPGQAVSYKVGEITIKNLRNKAEEALGDKFDIQEFHERILSNGSVPLPVLVEEIESYIEEKRSGSKK